MKLQNHGFEDSNYERPNRRWRCGRTCEGCPCKQGPSEKPVVNIFTASCSQKENPCKPQRTVRGQRFLLNLAVITFTFAIVVFILASQEANKAFINPGQLTSHHSTIEGQNCQTCHDLNGHDKWIQAAFSDHSSLADSKKCLTCHKFNTVSGEMDTAALNPHNMAHPELLGKNASAYNKELACMNCHMEHRGEDFDMKKMSNERCQSCHANSFNSLADGHPEFVLYPYKTSNYVNFSHKTHEGYFSDMKRGDLSGDANCKKCHNDNPDSGNTIRPAAYVQVCSSCHEAHSVPVEPLPLKILSLDSPVAMSNPAVYLTQEISADYVKGLTDAGSIRYLNQKNTLLKILNGKDSSKVSKMTLTPEKDIKALAGGLASDWDDILYIHEAAKQNLPFDKGLEWAVASGLYKMDKNLKNNSLKKNPSEVLALISKSPYLKNCMIMVIKRFGLKFDEANMTANLRSPDVFRFLENTFKLFPDDIKKMVPYDLTLDDKDSLIIKYLAANNKLSQKMIDELNSNLKTSASSIYKYAKELDLPTGSSVYYTKFYKRLEKTIEKEPELLAKLKKNYNDIIPVFISDLIPDKYVFKDMTKILDRKIQREISQDMKPDELTKMLKPYEIVLQLYAAYLIDDLAAPEGTSELNVPQVTQPFIESASELNSWKKSATENGTALTYNTVPYHASPLMVKAYSAGVFKSIGDVKESPGKCLMCHSRISDEKIDHWKTPEIKKSLTKFSHVPHGNACSSCHKFSDENEPALASFPNYHKDFRPMEKNDCIKCHKPDSAGDSCLKCHNYHAQDYAEMKSEILKMIEDFKKKP